MQAIVLTGFSYTINKLATKTTLKVSYWSHCVTASSLFSVVEKSSFSIAQTNKYTIYRAILNKHMFLLTSFHRFITLSPFRVFVGCSIGRSLSWSIVILSYFFNCLYKIGWFTTGRLGRTSYTATGGLLMQGLLV